MDKIIHKGIDPPRKAYNRYNLPINIEVGESYSTGLEYTNKAYHNIRQALTGRLKGTPKTFSVGKHTPAGSTISYVWVWRIE